MGGVDRGQRGRGFGWVMLGGYEGGCCGGEREGGYGGDVWS